jgi:hypothetical protein
VAGRTKLCGRIASGTSNLGLGFSDFAVLEYLDWTQDPPRSGSITAAVDRLEQNGMVERRNDSAGGARILPSHCDGTQDDRPRGLTPAERKRATELLRKLGLIARSLLQEHDKNRALSSGECYKMR